MTTMIHATAVIHPQARLGEGCEIGPYCIIGEHVVLGDRCKLHSHVVIDGHTTLGREACPLLRYRTGDLVKRIPRASGFTLEGGIIGRADDMVVVRGVNIYPSAIDAVVRSVPEIAEYRVTVTSHDALAEIALEIEITDDSAVSQLEHALTSAFSLRIPVRRVAELPRFELKAKRWTRQ